MYVAMNGVNVLFYSGDRPYEIHQGDVWECTDCGATVVVGWGTGAFAQHFESDFSERLRDVDHAVGGPVLKEWTAVSADA